MALAKKSSNSTRIVIIGVVIIVVAGIGYLLYREFFLNAGESGTETNAIGSKRVITEFHESVLNDPRYTTLKSYDQTISADANTDGGQANPFQ